LSSSSRTAKSPKRRFATSSAESAIRLPLVIRLDSTRLTGSAPKVP
jgi:hypothetical protein